MFTSGRNAGMNARYRACATYWLNVRRLHTAAVVDRYNTILYRRAATGGGGVVVNTGEIDGASERSARRTTQLPPIQREPRTFVLRTCPPLRLLLVIRTWTRLKRNTKLFKILFFQRARSIPIDQVQD